MIRIKKKVSEALFALLAMCSAVSLQAQSIGGLIGGSISDGVLNIDLDVANSFTRGFFGGFVNTCDPLVVVVEDQDFEFSKTAVKNYRLTDIEYIPNGSASVFQAELIKTGSTSSAPEYITISARPGAKSTVVVGDSAVMKIKPNTLRCK